MNHAAMVIGNPPCDGTPLELAEACVRFFAERMPLLLAPSLYDHQGGEIRGAWDLQDLFPISRWPKVGHEVFHAATEWDHRNCALAWIRSHWPKTERVWIVDTDEAYFDSDFEGLRKIVETTGVAAWAVRRYAYWKNMGLRIDPPEKEVALLAVDPGLCPAFFAIRRPWVPGDILVPEHVFQHHFTAVRTDEQMALKWRRFSHAREQQDGWFDRVWSGWQPGMTDLHPTLPAAWKTVVNVAPEDVPESVRRLYPILGVLTASSHQG